MIDLLMLFAIQAGTVPAHPPVVQAPPMEHSRVVTRKARTTVEFSFSKGITPLPAKRPYLATLDAASRKKWTTPYPFRWNAKWHGPLAPWPVARA